MGDIWHNCNNSFRKGKKANCSFCKKAARQKKLLSKQCGSKGGKAAAKNRKPAKVYKCKKCGKTKKYESRSGLCKLCYDAERREKTKRKVTLTCSGCGRSLNPANSTGLCKQCYPKSPKAAGARQQFSAQVFSQNANPEDKVKDS